MSDRLDLLIARLAAASPEASLEGFEHEVARGIQRLRATSRIVSALAPVRLASIGLALAIGATAGGAAADASIARARSSDLLSRAMDLAPSTLLEAAR